MEVEIRTKLKKLKKKLKSQIDMVEIVGIATTTIHVNKTKGEIKSLKWVLNKLTK